MNRPHWLARAEQAVLWARRAELPTRRIARLVERSQRHVRHVTSQFRELGKPAPPVRPKAKDNQDG